MLQQQFEKMSDPKNPQWLEQLRRENFDAYQKLGLPTIRDEAWKYTNVKLLAKKEFDLAEKNVAFVPEQYMQGLDAINVFIVNGHFHSAVNTIISGLTIKSLASAIKENLPAIEKLNQQAHEITHGFAKLNTAFIHDGLYLHLEKNTVLSKPIHIFYLNTQTESAQYLRNLILAESSTEATIIEHYLTANSSGYLTNSITEVYLEKAANIKHIKLQDEAMDAYHIGTTKVQQKTDSHFESYMFSFGGKLSRSDTEIALTEPGCYATQRGLYFGQDRQHFDHHTLADHQKPHCTSTQLYKGILDESSRAVFNGKVQVHRNAVKTDSAQMIKHLLLSDKAEADAKPELEIYNDDVKCSHGATVGQLDEDQLFYMLTRSLDVTTAKSLLMYAFSYEVIAEIKSLALRDYLAKLILKKLPANINAQVLLNSWSD